MTQTLALFLPAGPVPPRQKGREAVSKRQAVHQGTLSPYYPTLHCGPRPGLGTQASPGNKGQCQVPPCVHGQLGHCSKYADIFSWPSVSLGSAFLARVCHATRAQPGRKSSGCLGIGWHPAAQCRGAVGLPGAVPCVLGLRLGPEHGA